MKNNKAKDYNKLRRVHRQSFMLNPLELKAIDDYCEKYKIENRSRFIREIIISTILRKLEEDHPRLF